MSLQTQLQTALEGLAQASQRLETAAALAAERKQVLDTLRKDYDSLTEQLRQNEEKYNAVVQNESDIELLREEKQELLSVKNRLIAEKNQLLGEREQFKKFREGWTKERPILVKAKEDAEAELKHLKEEGGLSVGDSSDKVNVLQTETSTLREEKAELEEKIQTLMSEKESLSIELDGVRKAYEELKEITASASERLDSTLEELKILRG